MTFDEGLTQRIRDALRGRPAISERRMFGGIAFMSHGRMFIGVLGDTLMARVGPNRYAEALQQPWAREMDFTGKPMKGYVFVAPEGFESDYGLEYWLTRCLEFVESLPPK